MAAIRPHAPNQKTRLYARLTPEEVGSRLALIRDDNPHLQPRDEPLVGMLAANLIKAEAARAYQSQAWFLIRSTSGHLAFQNFERQLMALEQHVVKLATILGLTPESRWVMKIPNEKDVTNDPVEAARALARQQQAEFAAARDNGDEG